MIFDAGRANFPPQRQSAGPARDPEAPIQANAGVAAGPPPALRLIACGSVKDGKTTLIGRLLFDQRQLLGDPAAALERNSGPLPASDDDIDFALLANGPEAEREQGAAIGVAYRRLSTPRRSFIIADPPGDEQQTCDMAAGAAGADLAMLLVDAREGLLAQTCRHAAVLSLLRVKHVVLAVNKIDLTGFDEAGFEQIAANFATFAQPLGFNSITSIPISAQRGDNVSAKSVNTPWHRGPALLDFLESVDVASDYSEKPFRFPVQEIVRTHADFRGCEGTVASGTVRPGDEIIVAASGKSSKVARIVGADGDLDHAAAGDAVTLVLADELDIMSGDILSNPKNRPEVADQFAAHLMWTGAERLLPGRSYLLKIGSRIVPATVTELKHRLDLATLGQMAARTLGPNDIGLCDLATATAIAFDSYADNRVTGSFSLIDRASNASVATGFICYGLRRATNIHLQTVDVAKIDRARLNKHKPAALWFTGLSGAGKSTVANLVETRLYTRGVRTMLLDGDNLRHGLNKDLSFTEVDRVENIRRTGEVARLMTEAGLIVLCSFISPFRADRQLAREMFDDGEFIEIFVDTPISECIARDPKGLYKKALAGEIKNFTGIGQPYEPPINPELVVARNGQTASQAASAIVAALISRGIIDNLADWRDDWPV